MKKYCILKSIGALMLAVIMCSGLLINPIEAEAKKKSSGDGTYAEGDDIAFGTLDGSVMSWTILTYDDTTKTAFIVARKPLVSKTVVSYRKAIDAHYASTGTNAGYVRWSENYWRGWLNEVFYNQCFNDAEKEMILKTVLPEDDEKKSLMNYYHDTTLDAYVVAGNVKNSLNMAIYNSQTTTADYIFFLSSDEYTNNKDKMKFETKWLWPLRTNAYDDPNQGLFANDTDGLIYRMYYYSGDGIRPAMKVKLGEVEESTESTDSSSSKASSSSSSTKSTSSSSTSTASTATTTETKTTAKATTVSTKKYANNGTNTGNVTLPDDSSYTMTNGSTAQVAIDLEYLNSTEKNYTITYKSSNSSVFTVDSKGVITATGTGTASLTVRMKKSNGKTYTMSCRIDVT